MIARLTRFGLKSDSDCAVVSGSKMILTGGAHLAAARNRGGTVRGAFGCGRQKAESASEAGRPGPRHNPDRDRVKGRPARVGPGRREGKVGREEVGQRSGKGGRLGHEFRSGLGWVGLGLGPTRIWIFSFQFFETTPNQERIQNISEPKKMILSL